MSVEDGEVLAHWAEGRIDISADGLWAAAPGALQAILAARFGWEAVRGPGPLTFLEARLSLQYEAEERVGGPMRESARLARAREDAAYGTVREALG